MMDTNVLLAILGTLTGAVVSAFGTYIVQTKASEREKKWSLESENRKKTQEEESEKRKIRRDLICARLDIVEEAANIMLFLIGLAVNEIVGLNTYSDAEMMNSKKKRWEEIAYKAWAALEIINSKELKKKYSEIASAYGDLENDHFVDPEKWQEIDDMYKKLEKMIDDIKIEILSS
jgi:hypothetical protein